MQEREQARELQELESEERGNQLGQVFESSGADGCLITSDDWHGEALEQAGYVAQSSSRE